MIDRFEQLYEANVDSSGMTPGQMLLMGFAGMFSRLGADFTALLDAVSAVQTLDMYKKADLVREASMLQVPSVNQFVNRAIIKHSNQAQGSNLRRGLSLGGRGYSVIRQSGKVRFMVGCGCGKGWEIVLQ